MPNLPENSKVINVCPGCDKRYGKDFKGVSTISLWEIINENSFMNYPDYKGTSMTIIDACPTRDEVRVQDSIRELLIKNEYQAWWNPKTPEKKVPVAGMFTTDQCLHIKLRK